MMISVSAADFICAVQSICSIGENRPVRAKFTATYRRSAAHQAFRHEPRESLSRLPDPDSLAAKSYVDGRWRRLPLLTLLRGPANLIALDFVRPCSLAQIICECEEVSVFGAAVRGLHLVGCGCVCGR